MNILEEHEEIRRYTHNYGQNAEGGFVKLFDVGVLIIRRAVDVEASTKRQRIDGLIAFGSSILFADGIDLANDFIAIAFSNNVLDGLDGIFF